MTEIFGMSLEQLDAAKAIFTATEIHQQPDTWMKTVAQIRARKEEIHSFISKVTGRPDYDIVFIYKSTDGFQGEKLCQHRFDADAGKFCQRT